MVQPTQTSLRPKPEKRLASEKDWSFMSSVAANPWLTCDATRSRHAMKTALIAIVIGEERIAQAVPSGSNPSWSSVLGLPSPSRWAELSIEAMLTTGSAAQQSPIPTKGVEEEP